MEETRQRRRMDISTFYEREAAHHDVGHTVDGRIRRAARMFRRHLNGTPRLLDVGCGNGDIAQYLREVLAAQEVHGVEISQKRAESARLKGVQAVQLDLNQDELPFPDDYFQAIFCGEIIEHLSHTDRLLEGLHRVLAPAGLCVLTTPNLGAWFNRLALLLGWQPFETSTSLKYEVGRPRALVSDWGCRGHLQLFTARALRELLAAHGFRVVTMSGTTLAEIYGLSPWSAKPLRAALERVLLPLDRLLSWRPSLACRLIVAFRKSGGSPQPGSTAP